MYRYMDGWYNFTVYVARYNCRQLQEWFLGSAIHGKRGCEWIYPTWSAVHCILWLWEAGKAFSTRRKSFTSSQMFLSGLLAVWKNLVVFGDHWRNLLILEALTRLFGEKWGCFGLQGTLLVSANMLDSNGTFWKFWSNLAINCKFGVFVVKVNVFSNPGMFSKSATWRWLVFAWFWEFGNIQKRQAETGSWDVFGCVLASRKSTRVNSFWLQWDEWVSVQLTGNTFF